MVAVVVLSLGACKKKEEVKAPAAPVAPVEAPVPKVAPPVLPEVKKEAAMSAEQRAAKLGFAKYLPQDVDAVVAFHNGLKSVDRIKSTRIWKFILNETGMSDAAVGEAAGEANSPAEILFGTEFTVAMGKPSGEQGANLLTVYRRVGYFQMRMLARAFAAAAKSGDGASMDQAIQTQYLGIFKDVLADPESGIGLIERMKMPPLYLAFRTSAEQREAAAQELSKAIANLGFLGEMVEPVEVERAGQKFAGMKISGAKISEAMAKDGRKEMETVMDAAMVDRLIAAIAKKDIVSISGTLGDYAVMFVGSSVEDFTLAAAPAQSILASDAMAFSDAYASKELAAVVYGEKGATDRLIAATGGLADLAAGLRDGLAGSEGLGDTRDLEALLRMVGEREGTLRKLVTNATLGIVAFFENGFKIESYGGSDNGAIDWKSPNKLASLGDSEDVVMFANMTTQAAYDEKARAYMEALMETGYAMAMKASDLKIEDPKMSQFKEGFKLFNTQFRPDVVALWDAFSADFSGNLGQEWACVMDLNGAVPAIPGLPQAVVDAGKFPRISMLAPVKDRAKLAASWDKINDSLTRIMAKISEITEKKIPMQKPMSSQQDGFTTWFFSMPFFNDDFMPSVTVGDQWFAASTSKTQAVDLIRKAAKGGETRVGLTFTLNFKALQKYGRATLQVIDQNAAAIFGPNSIPTDEIRQAGKLIDAMEDLDKLTVYARQEAGVMRSSIHFKIR
jgi:hypothetical protein